jgi:predicted N-formylglutamate amidohydrolase
VRSDLFLVSCEHGGNRIPAAYRPHFAGHADLLASHRGYDAGALSLARHMAQTLGAPLYFSTVSRLLIDLNRSIGHPRLYSEISRKLSLPERQEILQRYYLPYRQQIETCIARAQAAGTRTIHISCHSFTPELDGEIRSTDIGLLYDPSRDAERDLCRDWRACAGLQMPELRIRMNYPYAGSSDGLTTALRRRYAATQYLGIELEVNQRQILGSARRWSMVRDHLTSSLAHAVDAAVDA